MLLDITTASPPYRIPQEIAKEELKKRMGGSPAVLRMIDIAARYSGIDSRYVVVPDADPEAKVKFFSNGNGFIRPD